MSHNKIKNTPIDYDNDKRIALLEQSIGHIGQTLIRLENKMDDGFRKIDERFDKVDDRFKSIDEKFDKKFDSLNNRLWTIAFWMVGGFVGTFTIMAHGFKWI